MAILNYYTHRTILNDLTFHDYTYYDLTYHVYT